MQHDTEVTAIIGYMVPIDTVRHFLVDIAGWYDMHGFPQLGIYTEMLENPTSKEYFKLDRDEGGILVVKILYGSPV